LSPGSILDSNSGVYAVSNEFWMLKGGFDETSARVWRYNQFDYYTSSISSRTLFLTRQHSTKKINRSQREWLYIRFGASYNDPFLRYRYYDKNGFVVGED